jgi:hypothetical protein
MRTEKQASVLADLEAGRSITVGECYHLYGTHDLRRIISRLRKAGHRIADSFENTGDGATYKRYYLQREVA